MWILTTVKSHSRGHPNGYQKQLFIHRPLTYLQPKMLQNFALIWLRYSRKRRNFLRIILPKVKTFCIVRCGNTCLSALYVESKTQILFIYIDINVYVSYGKKTCLTKCNIAFVFSGYSLYFNRTFAYGIYYYGIYFYEIYFYSSILLQTVYTSP